MSEPIPPPPFHESSTTESGSHDPSAVKVSRWLVVQLSAMMFMQFLPPGLWSVTVGTYIGENTGSAGSGMFDGSFVGIAGMASALGALVSPLLFGALADNWFRAERMLAALNLASAAMLVCMWKATHQWWFFAAMVGYFQFSSPSVTIIHSMALRHLAGARKLFPVVRASGTAGWIAALWIVGSIVPWTWHVPSKAIESTTWPLVFGIVGHLVMTLYALTLPRTLPQGKAVSWRTLLDGCRTLLGGQPRLVRFLLVSLCATMGAQFYNMFCNLYMNNQGIPNAATKLSYGQVFEILCMLVLPWLLVRWGPKRVFVLGIVAWIVRYLCMAGGGNHGLPLMLVYAAICVHGFCYVFVYVTGYIYVDHAATPETQSAAQGLLAMVTTGLGHLVGSVMSGVMQSRYLTPPGVEHPPYDWHAFFLVGALVSTTSLLLFWALMGFHREVMPGEIDPNEAV